MKEHAAATSVVMVTSSKLILQYVNVAEVEVLVIYVGVVCLSASVASAQTYFVAS
jgi:hypothetical protein